MLPNPDGVHCWTVWLDEGLGKNGHHTWRDLGLTFTTGIAAQNCARRYRKAWPGRRYRVRKHKL